MYICIYTINQNDNVYQTWYSIDHMWFVYTHILIYLFINLSIYSFIHSFIHLHIHIMYAWYTYCVFQFMSQITASKLWLKNAQNVRGELLMNPGNWWHSVAIWGAGQSLLDGHWENHRTTSGIFHIFQPCVIRSWDGT